MSSRKVQTLALAAAVALCLTSSTGLLTPASGDASSPARAERAAPAPGTFVAAVNHRIGVFRSKDGSFVRYLTPKLAGSDAGLPSVTPDRRRVFYVIGDSGTPCPSTDSIPYAGGKPRLERSPQLGGAQPIAVGPHGSLAGTLACLASEYVVARAANGKTYNINGLRNLGANGMSWAPDGNHLAVGTESGGVRYLDVRTKDADLDLGKTVPCPASVRTCTTTAPAYAPSGPLYYVVVNKNGTAAWVVRLAAGKGHVVFRLPHASHHFSLSVAAHGQILASGDANSATMTHSDFVVRWDGKKRHTLKRVAVQVDW